MSEHVPTVTIVMSSPETVQMSVDVDVNETERPDEEVGERAKVLADHARSSGSANVIV